MGVHIVEIMTLHNFPFNEVIVAHKKAAVKMQNYTL